MPKQCCRCAAIWLLPIFANARFVFAALALGVCLTLPSNATVVDAFREPSCARCAGNRGIEYSVAPASAVAAGVHGTITFAGGVADTNYVVVQSTQNPRVRITYGGLAAVHVQRGQVVARGDILGVASGRLHVGVRISGHISGHIGERYIDPARLADHAGGALATGARPRHRVTLGAVPDRRCVERGELDSHR